MDPPFNINCLPADIFLEIFGYLSHNELALISRVCRKWNEHAWSPALWKNVNVTFVNDRGSQNEVTSNFVKRLPASVRHLKLHFYPIDTFWDGKLNFQEFCIKLKEICPDLHTLILHHAFISEGLPTVIDLCNEFLMKLKVLILRRCYLGDCCINEKFEALSKIEILDISKSLITFSAGTHAFSKMHSLKKLNLSGICKPACYNNGWLCYDDDDVSYLHQLEFLDLGFTNICSRNFRVLQKHASNLVELFLCDGELHDDDFEFTNTVFPFLKTICLRGCDYVTCEGIVSLLQSCKSLKDVYVNKAVVQSFVNHSFVSENVYLSNILKAIDDCHHYKILDYSLD